MRTGTRGTVAFIACIWGRLYNGSMSIDELRSRLRAICEKQEVIRLDMFGSRARSRGRRGEDWDFVVEFSDAEPAEYSKRFFEILHALEDELDSPVDLLTYSSLKKNSLKRKIEAEKVSLYER